MGSWRSLQMAVGSGWKELEIEDGAGGWKELYFDEIDMGGACVNCTGTTGALYTYIDLNNPANGSGTLTNACIWVNTSTTGLKIGSFYLVSGTTYKCRDVYSIGSLSPGQNPAVSISLDVVTGDLMGLYASAGQIDRAYTGGGFMYVLGDKVVVDNETSYTASTLKEIACYGST